LIDCRSQEYQLIPYGSDDASPVVIIVNSNVKHSLASSEYPVRVKECREAVDGIKRLFGDEVRALRDVTLEILEQCRDVLSSVV
jgi:galactokinase